MDKTLSNGQRSLLETLLVAGTAERSSFSEADLSLLIQWNYIRVLHPNRVGITPFGTAALHPETAESDMTAEHRSKFKQDSFTPLTDASRHLLGLLVKAGGTLPPLNYDGRVAYHLEQKGLVRRAEDGTLSITPAGEQRAPTKGQPGAPTPPQAVAHPVPPNKAALVKRPEPPPAPRVPVERTPTPEGTALRVRVIFEGMDEAHFKARVLDMLMETSPSVAEFYESIRKAEDAAGRLKGV